MKKLVLQSDFGLCDGAVSAMYGVALKVNPELAIYDLTHEIPQYNIWEASYRLYQTVAYWPEETVFISVVDPGVGTERKSVVIKTLSNQYIVTPNNGTLTHILSEGIKEIREIDESVNRLPESSASYTFHGRDIYAYTAARLAAGVIDFEGVGPKLELSEVIALKNRQAYREKGVIHGHIDILDVRFGNVWTSISRELFETLDVNYGESYEVTICRNERVVYKNKVTYGRSFADSHVGGALLFVNSVDSLGIAINQGSFAEAYKIGTGSSWTLSIQKSDA